MMTVGECGVRWCRACDRLIDRDRTRKRRKRALAYFLCRVCRQAFTIADIYAARRAGITLPLQPTANQPLRRLAS